MSSSTKRTAAAFAVLILVTAMLPACAMMCCALQTSSASRMMAAMPCCANVPSMRSSHNSGPQDATLTSSAKAPVLIAIAAILPTIPAMPRGASIALAHFRPDSALTTSAFLRNEQFRI